MISARPPTGRRLFAGCLLVLGLVYPLVVTGIAGVGLPRQAHGSPDVRLQRVGGGFEVIAQPVTDPRYFHPRPSAVDLQRVGLRGVEPRADEPTPYRAGERLVAALRESGVAGPIPADLVMASASGLDPHLSVEAALVQAPLVARPGTGRPTRCGHSSSPAGRRPDPVPPRVRDANALNRALDAP